MSTGYFSVYHVYTMLLFLTVCYLLMLQRFYFPKYVDLSTKIVMNINMYLFLLSVLSFLFALAFSMILYLFCAGAEEIGRALIWYATDGPGLEPTHEIVQYPNGEYTVFNKQTGETIRYPAQGGDKTNTSTLTVERGTVKDNANSTGSPEVHSPAEKKKSFLGNVANKLFRNLPQGGQQVAISQGADLLKDAITESNLQPGNERIALMVVDTLADTQKVRLASELNFPDCKKDGVDVTLASIKRPLPDGSIGIYQCLNPVKGYKDYLGLCTKAGVTPEQSLLMQKLCIACGEGAGFSDLVCVLDQDILFSSNLLDHGSGPGANDGTVYDPGTPTGKPFDSFNH